MVFLDVCKVDKLNATLEEAKKVIYEVKTNKNLKHIYSTKILDTNNCSFTSSQTQSSSSTSEPLPSLPTVNMINNENQETQFDFEFLNSLEFSTLNEDLELDTHENTQPQTLIMPSKTRWASNYYCLDRLLNARNVLKGMADSYRIPFKVGIREIIQDSSFWVNIHTMLIILKPIAEAILYLESDSIRINEVFHYVYQIEKSINELANKSIIEYELYEKIHGIFLKRKMMLIKPIHLAAYLLDPKYKGMELTREEVRIANKKIQDKARFRFPDESFTVIDQLIDYNSGKGDFSEDWIIDSIQKVDPIRWWSGCFLRYELAQIAVEILSIHPTTASVERYFSKFGFIHSIRRNRLSFEKGSKLCHISYNNKALNRSFKDAKLSKSNLVERTESLVQDSLMDVPSEFDGFDSVEDQFNNNFIL